MLENERSKDDCFGPVSVLFAHLYGLFKSRASLVNVFGEKDFILRVDSRLNLALENEVYELFFQSVSRRVESDRHLPQLGRFVRTEVLEEM